MKKFTLLPIITILSIGMVFGHKESLKHISSAGCHYTLLSCLGDFKKVEDDAIYSYTKPTSEFYLEKKIVSNFGFSLNGTFGKVSKIQLDNDLFLNFETSIMNVDANLCLDFDNGKVINEEHLFFSLLSFGVGCFSFDPKGYLFSNVTLNYFNDVTSMIDKVIAVKHFVASSVITEYRKFKAGDLSGKYIECIQKKYEEVNDESLINNISIPEKFKMLNIDHYVYLKEVSEVNFGFFLKVTNNYPLWISIR